MNQAAVRKEGNLTIYELVNHQTKSSFQVVPERGGIVISLKLLGDELLFLNEETLHNPDSNIRGGIPILFPICGQLEHGEYELHGQTFPMKNHGVARNHPWQVLQIQEENELSITLGMRSNEETKRSFPFDFELIFRYELQDHALIIHQEYWNHSEIPMPMYSGFHPYFATDHKTIHIKTDATQYLDYNDGGIKGYEGSFNLSERSESVVLLDTQEPQVSFALPEINRNVMITYDKLFRYMVIWTELGSPFMCVEPWMAKTNEMNLKKELLYVQPKEALRTRITISVDQ
ncbi:aldose epimerase [Brevibacillus ginsengisoli]|uniref:aldose epimerase family protein n=1 Tax=Brevibacillus ginsengisoli TaxID=363854 RepID=UPI003CF0E999